MISTFSRRKRSLANQISVFLFGPWFGHHISFLKMADIEELSGNPSMLNKNLLMKRMKFLNHVLRSNPTILTKAFS